MKNKERLNSKVLLFVKKSYVFVNYFQEAKFSSIFVFCQISSMTNCFHICTYPAFYLINHARKYHRQRQVWTDTHHCKVSALISVSSFILNNMAYLEVFYYSNWLKCFASLTQVIHKLCGYHLFSALGG